MSSGGGAAADEVRRVLADAMARERLRIALGRNDDNSRDGAMNFVRWARLGIWWVAGDD